jgi:microcystin-dependent protein
MAGESIVNANELSGVLQAYADRLDSLESAAGSIPTGLIAFCAGALPDGWLVCDGSTISAQRYGQLAAYMNSTTLPNLLGKAIVGKAASGTFGTLGASGGVATITLTASQSGMPTHTTGAGSPHSHTMPDRIVVAPPAGGNLGAAGNYNEVTGISTNSESSHTHSVTGQTAASSFDNMPPYQVWLPIIKF